MIFAETSGGSRSELNIRQMILAEIPVSVCSAERMVQAALRLRQGEGILNTETHGGGLTSWRPVLTAWTHPLSTGAKATWRTSRLRKVALA